MAKKYQSAKVFVFDFHFDSNSKEEIAKKKEELDKFFDNMKEILEHIHKDTAVEQVFLRKH